MLGFLVTSISTLFCLYDFLGVCILEDFSPSPATSLTSPINGSILIELVLLKSPFVGVGGIGSTKSILPSSPFVASFFLLILTGLPWLELTPFEPCSGADGAWFVFFYVWVRIREDFLLSIAELDWFWDVVWAWSCSWTATGVVFLIGFCFVYWLALWFYDFDGCFSAA
jgi:hypothetical protein